MRDTSVAVYVRIRDEGLLSRARWDVYDALYRHGPLTGSELNSHLRSKSAHKRVSELVERGLVREVGVRRCTVTLENVLAWDVTSRLPVEPTKSPSQPSKRQLRVAVEAMRARHRQEPFDDDTVAVMRWIAAKAAGGRP